MKPLATLTVAAVGLVALVGCSSSSDSTSATPSAAQTTSASDPYADYMQKAVQTNGALTTISAQDAATRAQLLCQDPSIIAVPLKTLPTDFLLVGAYCPEKMSEFKQ
jgi:hypothetical protein